MDRQIGIAITSMEEKVLSKRIVCATAILFNLGIMWNFADYIKTLTRKEILIRKRLNRLMKNREHCHLKDIKLSLSDSCHNFPLYHDYDLPVHGHACDVLHL